MMKNKVITYTVDKVLKGNLHIYIQNGEVIVKAPWYLTSSEIQEIVEEKRKWIKEKINQSKKQTKKEIEEITLLGRKYNVELIYKNVKKPEVKREKEKIKLIISNKYKKEDKAQLTRILIEKMFYMIAEKEVERAMEKTRNMLKFAPEDYKIEEIKSLAKVKQDNIIINPEIVKYDRETIDYIILHQFIKLKYKTNSKNFTKMLVEFMPNYKKYQERVSKYL